MTTTRATTRRKLIVGAAITASTAAGALTMTAPSAFAVPGPPITVYTTDAPPPGGEATFDPQFRRLTVCDREADSFGAVAQLRWSSNVVTAPAGGTVSCGYYAASIPDNVTVSLRVCLSRSGGPLVFCSAWKSTHT